MSMSMSMSIRVRLTLWYVLLLSVILAAFTASVYLVLRHTLYGNLDESIERQASVLLDETVQFEEGRPSLGNVLPSEEDELEHFVRVFDASQNVTFDNRAPRSIFLSYSTASIGSIRPAAALTEE